MNSSKKNGVVIIGAGAIGSALARELSKYDLNIVLIEKNEDIGGCASKSNSATIVTGYDSPPGSLESILSVNSNPMFDAVCEELEVPFKRIGALQVGYSDEDLEKLHQGHKKAMDNGVFDVEFITGEEARRREPVLSKNVKGALYIPRESIINVFELLAGYVENAKENGVTVMTGTKVLSIEEKNGKVTGVTTTEGDIPTDYVVNAAALYADEIAKTVGLCDFRNYPRKGQIFVLDKNLPYAPKHVIVPIPTPLTRGKLLTPSIDGNLLVGPTAENLEDKGDKSTTAAGLADILADVRRMVPEIDPRDSVTQFAGLRPARDPAEYSIRAFDELHGYIEVNGITQGVSCSLSASKWITELLRSRGLELRRKTDFQPRRKAIVKFSECSRDEQSRLIAEDSRYGNIICRCETVSEAEIVEAIRRGARSMDAIKRRVRSGMGRCQGGFCGPRIVEILARELLESPEEVRKNEPGSMLLVGASR